MLQPDHADMRPAECAAPPVLRIAGVRAGYGGQSVLRDAAFTLHAGECAALLGPNGSGKTTLLRTLSGVLTPQAGAIEIQGRPLATLKPRERARMVAVVPQRGQLPQGLTARQMVLLGRFAHLSWLGSYGREDYAAADRALEETGAAPLAQRRLNELSGGELQRVLLARALAQESPLLLLGWGHGPLLTAAFFGGGVLLVWADVLARCVLSGGQELPVGVVTALLGGPFFALLVRRR